MTFLNVCEDSGILSVILIAKNVLDIISLIVPIILIVLMSVEVGKVVFAGDVSKTIPKVKKSVVSKCIAAVAIFFVPSLVNLLLSMLGQNSYTAGVCWENANSSTIAQVRAVEEARKLQEQEELNREAEEARKQRELIEQLREEQRKKNEEEAKKLTGGMVNGIVYYYQCDYKSYKYSSYGTICSHGCGPTSCAVIASTFLGKEGHTPVDTTKWICSHGGCYSSGTSWSGVTKYLKHVGLNVSKSYSWSSANVKLLMEKLATGNYLAVILVRNNTGRGIFTKGGHYFVLTGVKDGEFTIAQVSSKSQTKKTWPKSAFDGDVHSFYLVSKN